VKKESVVHTQRSFRVKFGNEHKGRVPSQKTIISWVKQWRETGSVVPMKRKGPKQTVRKPGNITAVTAAFQQSPTSSL
jgi:hypothetical protein